MGRDDGVAAGEFSAIFYKTWVPDAFISFPLISSYFTQD